MTVDAENLKKEFLKLLDSDEEFRLAVAGKVGLLEILVELRRLREDFNRLYAKGVEHDKRFEVIELELKKLREDLNKHVEESTKRFEAIEKKLLEHDKHFEAIERKLLEHDKRFEALERKLLEHDKRFEAIERKLLEHDKRFETIEKKLLEHDKRFEAIEQKLLEHDKRFETIEQELLEHSKKLGTIELRLDRVENKLEEHDRKFNEVIDQIRRIWEVLADHNRRLSHVEDMLGALAESTYAKFTLDALIHEAAFSGDRIVRWERNARIDNLDIDLLVVTERRVYVVEVKVCPRHSDVDSLVAKARAVERRFVGKEVIPILVGTRVGSEIHSYAVGRGVKVFSW